MAGRALPLVLAALVAAGCGGGAKPHGAATPTPSRIAPAVETGRIVDIGGGRSLYLNCVGSGSPTVVLEAGFGGDSHNWSLVQPQIGRTTRTCAYDRAGLGNSVARPGVVGAAEQTADLQRLLEAAHLDPPYVLVGHSYGGLLMRVFAVGHPGEAGAVVLVDAMGRDQRRRQLAIWPKSQASTLRRSISGPVQAGVDVAAGAALDRRTTRLGHTPVVVVTAARHDDEWGRVVPRRLGRALDRQWTALQDELAALSPDHVHVVALRSDHFVMGPDGQPALVIRAVRAAVAAVRAHRTLPPCARLFGGADARCRA